MSDVESSDDEFIIDIGDAVEGSDDEEEDDGDATANAQQHLITTGAAARKTLDPPVSLSPPPIVEPDGADSLGLALLSGADLSGADLSSADPIPPPPQAALLVGLGAAHVVDTRRFACSVEGCLVPGHGDAVVVGTYQLDEAAGTRDGGVQLYRVHEGCDGGGDDGGDDEDNGDSKARGDRTNAGQGADIRGSAGLGGARLELRGALDMAAGGVLDCKWDPAGSPLLACATARGSLALVALGEGWRGAESEGEGKGGVEACAALRLAAASSAVGHLFLSLDFDNRTGAGGAGGDNGGPAPTRIAVSESVGSLSLWRPDVLGADTSIPGGRESGLEARWHAHTYPCGGAGGVPAEAWTCCFAPRSRGSVLFSGADDGLLKAWDLRVPHRATGAPGGGGGGGGGVASAELAAVCGATCHGAGVTALACSPADEHQLLSGSYDGVVRLWDVRAFGGGVGGGRRPRPVAESLALGGGVWRLRWDGAGRSVLVAGMHGGAHVLAMSGACLRDDIGCSSGAGGGGEDSGVNGGNAGSGTGDSGARLSRAPLRAAPFPGVAVSYGGHGSMAYGADWCRGRGAACRPTGERGGGRLVVTCSFYDHAAHLWRVPDIYRLPAR